MTIEELAIEHNQNSQESLEKDIWRKLKMLLEVKNKEEVASVLNLNSSTVVNSILDNFVSVFTPEELGDIKKRVKIKEGRRNEVAVKFGEEQRAVSIALEENTTDTIASCRLDNRVDKMTGIFGPEQYLATMISSVETVIEDFARDGNSKNLERISVFFIDLNGLKAINDLGINGHGGGDLALKGVGEALNDEGLMTWLGKKGVEVIPVHKHGDEFLLSIIDQDGSSDINSKQEQFVGIDGEVVRGLSVSEYSMEYIVKVLKAKSVTGFMDMDNKKQRIAVENSVGDVPEGFKFELSFSSGHVNLLEVVENSNEVLTDSSLGYWERIAKLSGKMIGISDARMSENKLKDRAERSSGSVNARFLEEMYRFRAEEKPDRRVSENTGEGLVRMEKAIQGLKDEGTLNEEQLKAIMKAITRE